MSSIQVFLGFLEYLFNFAKPLSEHPCLTTTAVVSKKLGHCATHALIYYLKKRKIIKTLIRHDNYKTSMQNNRLTVTRCRRAGIGSTTFTLAQMTVAMLLWSSVMTWIYSCCWSTGHCTVIYRVISPSRWRSGTVLSYK